MKELIPLSNPETDLKGLLQGEPEIIEILTTILNSDQPVEFDPKDQQIKKNLRILKELNIIDFSLPDLGCGSEIWAFASEFKKTRDKDFPGNIICRFNQGLEERSILKKQLELISEK